MLLNCSIWPLTTVHASRVLSIQSFACFTDTFVRGSCCYMCCRFYSHNLHPLSYIQNNTVILEETHFLN